MSRRARKSITPLPLTAAALLLAIAATPAYALITALELEIRTGNDDLRGGSDNVNATVLLRDGRRIDFHNINAGERWQNGSRHTVPLRFNLTVDRGIAGRDDIVGLQLQSTFRGGIDGDNWDLQYLKVTPMDHSVGSSGLPLEPYFEQNGRSGGRPLWRFTGDNHPFVARWASQPNEVSHLRLVIRTGNDDLRGDNHLNLRIRYRGGEQFIANVNQGQSWANQSTQAFRVALDRPTRLTDLLSVTLETSSGGGIGGDNWDMTSLQIIPQMLGRESYPDCFNDSGRPLKRFTGERRTFEARCR